MGGPVPSPPAWNLTRSLAAGIAVLLVVGIWSGDAHAGCGDHVVILSKKTTDTDNADNLPVAPPPCHGPNCSLNQAPPAPLPSAPVDVKPLPLDALLLVEPVSGRDSGRDLFPDLTSLPVDQPSTIFRPPRCR